MNGKELEKKIQKYHFRLELIRTMVPVCVLCMQVVIFLKLFNFI